MCKCEVDRGLWIIDRMYEHTIGLYSLSRLVFCDESFQSRSGGYFWEYVDRRNASEAVEKLLWFRKSELVRRNLGRRVFDLRERFVSKLERWLTSGRGVVFLMAEDGGRRGLIIIYFLPFLFYLYLSRWTPVFLLLFFLKLSRKENSNGSRIMYLTIRGFCNSWLSQINFQLTRNEFAFVEF